MFSDTDEVVARFAQAGYIADHQLAALTFLSVRLGKPMLLEGEPGVGKTEVAKVLAKILGTELIRMQCYEGLDTHHALYEWNYLRQMIEVRLEEARGVAKEEIGRNIFSTEFLLKRPLLQAIQSEGELPPVLLIDEVDRSDEEFEAFLLEVLSDFQITIPELGTIKATRKPFVVLTSNRTRELHDALKRRCLYHWINYPKFEKELAIVRAKVPGIDESLARQICYFVERLRELDFYKRAGVAETLDWAQALLFLGVAELDATIVDSTMGCILKSKDDLEKFKTLDLAKLVADAKQQKP
ncbi:MAG: MoxR family ATPase [Betaproteobacteria bacterium]|nr:MoxR family ATPase [Betaproteobacteria bacterium]